MWLSKPANGVLPPTDIEPLERITLEPANPGRGTESQKGLLPIWQLCFHVLAQRQIRVLLRPHKGPHEEEQDHRPLPAALAIGARGVPEAALEYEGGAGWAFSGVGALLIEVRSCASLVFLTKTRDWFKDTYHCEDIAGCHIAQMRTRINSCGAVLVGDIFQVEHDVHTIRHVPRWRRNGKLIRM